MDLEVGLAGYCSLGFSSSKNCLTGSGAVAVYDKIARARKLKPLLPQGRVLGDIDIYTGRLGHVFSEIVHNANLAARYERGTSECVTFDLNGASYDVSCRWPFLVADDDIESVSEEVGGVRVMALGRIADCKRLFGRPKDLADLKQIEIGLGLRHR